MSNDRQSYTVSVVIPAYNAEEYIGRAIDSVLAQTRQPDEIIVVDDGSTDNTAEVIKSYGSKVCFIGQENGGASVARNTGIEAAKSEWIAFLDADDEWLPEKLRLQIEHLKRNSDLVWSYSNYIICPSDGDHQRDAFQTTQSAPLMKGLEYYEDYLEAYARVGHLLTSSTIIKRNVLAEAGYFRVGQWWAQDTDMFLRVAYRWPRIGYIPQPLVMYHVGLPGSITEKNRGLITQRCDLVEHHLELAAKYGRGYAFKACALEMLRHSMRTALAGNPYADVSEVLERFDSLLPTPLKREMRLRMKWPRMSRFCLFVYFRLKRALRASKQI